MFDINIRIMRDKDYFILMADVTDSRNYNQENLISEFRELTQSINQRFKKNLLSPLTITLGDEFQGIIENSSSAIDIIIGIEESFVHKKLDFKLRYVLVEGKIETAINKDIGYGMLGPGLTQAREKLEELKNSKNKYYFQFKNTNKSTALNLAFNIYQRMIDDWKPEKDYNIVSEFFKNRDYKKVAEITNKTRSQIWKREKSLRIEEYFSLKELIKYIVADIK